MLQNFRKAGTNNFHMEFRENHRKLVRSDDEMVILYGDLEGKFQEAYIYSVVQIRTHLNETTNRLLASTGISSLDFRICIATRHRQGLSTRPKPRSMRLYFQRLSCPYLAVNL